MFSSGGNVSSDIGGYFLETRLDEVIGKYATVYNKVKELEFMLASCQLSPIEVINFNKPEKNDDQDSGKDQTPHQTNVLFSPSIIFVVSIPPGLINELNQNLDVEHNLRVTGRELSNQLYDQKKEKRGIDLGFESVM